MSQGTVTKYLQAVTVYAEAAGPPPGTTQSVRDRLASLRDSSASTVRTHLSAIKSFCDWYEAETGTPNPCRRIRAPRRPDRLPHGLSEAEVRLMIEGCDGSWMGARDRAILEAFYSTGCRAAELLGIRLEDLDLSDSVVRVIGKGNRERICLLTPSAVAAISRWLQLRTAEPTERRLFVSRYGQGLSAMGLWKVIRERGSVLGKHVHAHMFRHACAVALLKGGADLRSIQLLLGHRSLSTTQVYLQLDNEYLRDVHARAHPMGRRGQMLRTAGGKEAMKGEDT